MLHNLCWAVTCHMLHNYKTHLWWASLFVIFCSVLRSFCDNGGGVLDSLARLAAPGMQGGWVDFSGMLPRQGVGCASSSFWKQISLTVSVMVFWEASDPAKLFPPPVLTDSVILSHMLAALGCSGGGVLDGVVCDFGVLGELVGLSELMTSVMSLTIIENSRWF